MQGVKKKLPFTKDELRGVIQRVNTNTNGNGVDYLVNAKIKESVRGFSFEKSYHVINEWGYYDGFVCFKVFFPYKDPAEFKITYLSPHCRKVAIRNGLEEYLRDLIYYQLVEEMEKVLNITITSQTVKVLEWLYLKKK